MTDGTISTNRKGSSTLYKAFFVCSALTCAVGVWFFLVGLGDGSISSFNMGLWLTLLAVLGFSLGGGYTLHANGRHRAAIAALAITAIPGIIGAFFILLLIVFQPRWN